MANKVASDMAASLTFNGAIGAIDWSGAVLGAAGNIGPNIAALMGGYLAHELVPAQTHQGAVGGQLLGAVGSAVGISLTLGQGLGFVLDFIIPGIGSLIGTIVGTLIGDHFGSTPHPAAIDLVDQAGYFYGYGHYDVLDGGAGADAMFGGAATTPMRVDNVAHVVVENAGEGNDTVWSLVDYAIPANVEYLVLAGTASINGAGNSADNIMLGNSGNNIRPADRAGYRQVQRQRRHRRASRGQSDVRCRTRRALRGIIADRNDSRNRIYSA